MWEATCPTSKPAMHYLLTINRHAKNLLCYLFGLLRVPQQRAFCANHFARANPAAGTIDL